jgi:hypothetical protein
MKHYQGAVIDAAAIGNWARDLYGGVNSVVLEAGTVLAFATNSSVFVPIKGAEATTAVAVGSQVVYVNCATQFTVGDNVKIGKPGHQNIIDAVEQDLGAILSVYTTSKTLTVTADSKIISAVVTGDYVFVEPGTADGTADAVAILHQTIKMTDPEGSAQDTEARIVRAGFVKTKALKALTARAKLQLAGLGAVSPGTAISFDDVAT